MKKRWTGSHAFYGLWVRLPEHGSVPLITEGETRRPTVTFRMRQNLSTLDVGAGSGPTGLSQQGACGEEKVRWSGDVQRAQKKT